MISNCGEMLRRLGLIDFGGEGRVAGTRFVKTGRQFTTNSNCSPIERETDHDVDVPRPLLGGLGRRLRVQEKGQSESVFLYASCPGLFLIPRFYFRVNF